MKFVASGHVRITGARLTQVIEAPNARKAAAIGQEWARENDLAYDGVETLEEHQGRAYPGRYADEDRGGRNTMTRNADADLCTPED